LVCAVFGASWLSLQIVRQKQCTAQVNGIISTCYWHGAPYLGLTYMVDGIEYSKPFSGSDTFSAGQAVTVVYKPSNPERYYIAEDKQNARILGLAFAFGGLVFVLIGYGHYRGLF
jgi:hypothetical protein